MNKSTPYEQLIAGKLEQVPVPNIADDIWNSIGQQLDAAIEIPDSKSSKKFNGKRNYGYWGSIILTAALTTVGVYYGTKVPGPKTIKPENKIPVIEIPIPAGNIPPAKDILPGENLHPEENISPAGNIPPAGNLPPAGNIPPLENPVKKKPAVKIPAATPPRASIIKTDTAEEHKLPPERRFDSIAIPPVIYRPPAIDSSSIFIQPKKPKGVKGISPDDYRISIDKDTLKKE